MIQTRISSGQFDHEYDQIKEENSFFGIWNVIRNIDYSFDLFLVFQIPSLTWHPQKKSVCFECLLDDFFSGCQNLLHLLTGVGAQEMLEKVIGMGRPN